MKESTREEITRIFGNRESEADPFHSGSAGMEWFSRMLPLAHELSCEEINTFLVPLMDALLLQVKGCAACRAKGLVFAELYCARSAPDKANSYREQYETLLSRRRPESAPRDYREEVYGSIRRYLKPALYNSPSVKVKVNEFA